MNKIKVLLIEDDVTLRFAIEAFFSQLDDFQFKTAGSIPTAKKIIEKNDFDIILTDIRLSGGLGYDLISFAKEREKDSLFVVMTAFGTIEEAVKAMKCGAYDFIEKPFELAQLEAVLRHAYQDRMAKKMAGSSDESSLIVKNISTTQTTNYTFSEKVFITENHKMIEILNNLKKVASSMATVLVQGESGTGKEVIASLIHSHSPRAGKAFIAINCAAMPDSLLESELFGHEKGSFTGAIQRQIGKFELSDGGTIFLDEISEMSLNMQTKLLRVLQEREVYRVGGGKSIPLNLRVIASTNRDLYQYMKQGSFREDLYYRINVVPITVPPLRERGEDVIVLAHYFLKQFSEIHKRPLLTLDELACYKIKRYPWHGNVRELRNAMERAILVNSFNQIVNDDMIAEGGDISEEHADNLVRNYLDMDKDMTLDQVEKRVILETLRRHNGNRTRTAEKLGISLRTLRNKLKSFRDKDGHFEHVLA